MGSRKQTQPSGKTRGSEEQTRRSGNWRAREGRLSTAGAEEEEKAGEGEGVNGKQA